MRISAISGVRAASQVIASRKSDVVLRMDAIRDGIRKHGAVIVNPENEVDAEAIKRFKKIHGADNVIVEQSTNAKLTITNFKR